jgi:hypothetical protein
VCAQYPRTPYTETQVVTGLFRGTLGQG